MYSLKKGEEKSTCNLYKSAGKTWLPLRLVSENWSLIFIHLLLAFYLRKPPMLVLKFENSAEWETKVSINSHIWLLFWGSAFCTFVRGPATFSSPWQGCSLLLLDWCRHRLSHQAAPDPSKEDNFIAGLLSLFLVLSWRHQFSQVKNTNKIQKCSLRLRG